MCYYKPKVARRTDRPSDRRTDRPSDRRTDREEWLFMSYTSVESIQSP
jgi:hypothetical protein